MNIKVHLFNIIKACNNAHLALFEFLSVLMKWRLFSCHCTELRLAKNGEGDNTDIALCADQGGFSMELFIFILMLHSAEDYH